MKHEPDLDSRAVMVTQSSLSASQRKSLLKRTGHWLHRYRPRFNDWHFWMVQGLVIVIAAIHDVIELGGYLPQLGMLYFVPISLFFIPVVYAALNFGFAGSISTALWIVLITIPNWVFWHHGLERVGVIFQMAILVVVAVFVGQRVDRETSARRRAEAASALLRASEMKYRSLFESSRVAILVVDMNGVILDANPAAGVLFGKATETLKSITVADLVGTENEQKLLAPSQKNEGEKAYLTLSLKDSPEVYLEPLKTTFADSQDNIITQILLRDVTLERHRQVGLKAYAAYVLRAQEDERQRIARELHDDSIQTLVLLCRQLSSVESTSPPLPSSVTNGLRDARKIAEGVVNGLRDFARVLRPPILDDLGVVASIRRLLTDFTKRTGISGQFKLVGKERRLPQDIEVGMFRIAQEALWNVERHSGATEVVVTMAFANHEARLDMKDNGTGFSVPPSPEYFPTSGQLGLLGMHERAELLNGELEIQSSPGKGTKVTISIPIPEGILEASDT